MPLLSDLEGTVDTFIEAVADGDGREPCEHPTNGGRLDLFGSIARSTLIITLSRRLMTHQHVDLRELREAFARFQGLPFPHVESESDELCELRYELVMHDSHAAGLIHSIAGAAPIWPHELNHDRELRTRIAAHAHDPDPTAAADAGALLAYLDELDAVIATARDVHARTRVKREPAG